MTRIRFREDWSVRVEKILLVGISYDEKKGHTCVIEEYKKSGREKKSVNADFL